MFKQYLQKSCAIFILFSFAGIVSAEIYKWVDNEGNVHYSERAPQNAKVDIIKTPPPPAVDPAVAQKEIDTLIEKQNGTFEAKEEERRLAKEELARQKQLDEYCKINRSNLTKYQNNPGRRMIDADGNVTRPTEEQRQQKIAEIQKQLAENCQ